jgi:hypothetical protein
MIGSYLVVIFFRKKKMSIFQDDNFLKRKVKASFKLLDKEHLKFIKVFLKKRIKNPNILNEINFKDTDYNILLNLK